MTNLKTTYQKTIAPRLAHTFSIKNTLAVPRLVKVVVNAGITAQNRDPKIAEVVASVVTRITGQRPVPTLAKKSIANFKTREGMVVGYMVTLRGARMYDFIERLIRLTLPRVRDFRGIAESNVDKNGNLSIGFKEYVSFPEIRADEVEKTHGLQVTIVTTARNRERGIALFRELGIPFRK